MDLNNITVEQLVFIKKGEILNMFGIKLNNNIQVNIGDKYDIACDKINEFLSLNEDKLWGESEELNDKMLSTKITIYSKGPVVPYEEVTFIIIDEIVTDINIFKLVLNEEELKVEEAYKKYKDNYIEKSFCEQMGCELKECDAIKKCEYASKNGCNVGCPYNKHEKRWIVLDDQNVIVSIVKSGFENMVTGKDKYNKPMYCSIDLEYDGISLACYLEDEDNTSSQAS